MNSTCQTALQLGMEYSQRLLDASHAYQELTGKHPGVDGEFWESPQIEKLEVLSAFYWQLHRINNPFGDGTCYEENFDEENRN